MPGVDMSKVSKMSGQSSFPKDNTDRGLLLVREQVPVAPPHFLGGVADLFVDDALIDALGGAT